MYIICLNHISRAGNAPCAIDPCVSTTSKQLRDALREAGVTLVFVALLVVAAHSALARDSREIGDWLCAKIFEGGDITLAFASDGFFGMRIAPRGKSIQNITGLWRLATDGVDLTLYTLQDSRISMSVGRGALYALIGGSHVTLLPIQKEKASFRVMGMLHKSAGTPVLIDAGSGMDIEVDDDANAADGKFATAEIEIGKGVRSRGRIIKHSGAVPRLLGVETQNTIGGDFARDVADRFWLLPANLWHEGAALRFSGPERDRQDKGESGSYEVSGPGLRLEGKYRVTGQKLVLIPDVRSLRNLKILDAEPLAKAFSGEATWKLTSRGLDIAGGHGRILLLAP